jgi:hypothetical protein
MLPEFVPRQRGQTTRAGCAAATGAMPTTGARPTAAAGGALPLATGLPHSAQKRLSAEFVAPQLAQLGPAGCDGSRGANANSGAAGRERG